MSSKILEAWKYLVEGKQVNGYSFRLPERNQNGTWECAVRDEIMEITVQFGKGATAEDAVLDAVKIAETLVEKVNGYIIKEPELKTTKHKLWQCEIRDPFGFVGKRTFKGKTPEEAKENAVKYANKLCEAHAPYDYFHMDE